MPIDLEKVSKGAAISRGVEVFIEMTLFYGLLTAILVWDISKRRKETQKTVECLDEFEDSYSKLEDYL